MNKNSRHSLCSSNVFPYMENVLRGDINFNNIILDIFDPVSLSEVCDISSGVPTKSCKLITVPLKVLENVWCVFYQLFFEVSTHLYWNRTCHWLS